MVDKKRVAIFVETARKAGRSMLRGAIRYAESTQNWVFYHSPPFYTRQSPKRTSATLARLKKWKVDGIIAEEPDRFDWFIQHSVPVVISISSSPDCYPRLPRIMSRAGVIAEMAVNHFRERGICHFAFCGHDGVFWSGQRSTHYAEKVRQLQFDTYLYEPPRARHKRLWENEISHLVQWLRSLPKPVGILCCNDERGVEVIEACKEAKIRIPEDAAILGVDDDHLVCTLSSPGLSSISLDFETTGWQAAHLLDRLMQGDVMSGQEVPVEPQNVVTRHSTEILALNDRTLTDAIKYIREHSTHFFGVDEVASATATARRTLEKKFRTILGCTIHDQIRRTHVERIAAMLRETNLTISEIASRMGFGSEKNLSRYFRKDKGISPREYRRHFCLSRPDLTDP
jgi:LacI family transcriptional regulator